MKKILILNSSSDLYGANRVLLMSVKALKQKGNEVTVVLSSQGVLFDELQKEGCLVKIIPLAILRRKYFSISGILNRISAFRKGWFELKLLYTQQHFDLIYSNTLSVFMGALLAKKYKVDHLWHIHEILIHPNWLVNVYAKYLMPYGGHFIAVSHAVKDYWQKRCPSAQMIVLHNGFVFQDVAKHTLNIRQKLSLQKDTLLIGMVGRVHPGKGQSYFLDIAKHLCEKGYRLHFLMVGDVFPGNEHLNKALESQIESLDLVQHVSNLGYRTDVLSIMKELDIFILPSTEPDSFPTTILEAMFMGRPVIATDQGGAKELVDDGVTGFLIPLNLANEAADKIEILLEDQLLREEMGEKGRKKVLNVFTFEKYAEQLNQIIERF